MAKRRKKQESKHNKKVRKIAKNLKKKGWKVKADIPGYDKPAPIGKHKYTPDIKAKKAGAERIIEVETSETKGKDKKQQEAFRRSAAQKKRASFWIEEA